MNTKISLPELIDQLSRKSNCTKKEAEQFLKEFFSLTQSYKEKILKSTVWASFGWFG